jgi:preprotein translocase subunit SecF
MEQKDDRAFWLGLLVGLLFGFLVAWLAAVPVWVWL